jgi:thiamine-phosphate pyrophosphorylase
VQIREPDLSDEALRDLIFQLRGALREGASLMVNGRPDLALAAGADGAHLKERQIDAPLPEILRKRGLIGRSVHDLEGIRRAEAAGADYLQLGHVFATASHPGEPPRGWSLIREATRITRLPVLAVGGIDATNAGACIAAGASGVAVISAIGGASDPAEAARCIRRAMRSEWERS